MSTAPLAPPSADDVAAVQRCEQAFDRLRAELAKVIVGQDEVIEQVLVAIFARGHALLEGVPGLAKTLLVSSLAEALHLSFKRIQFTPDLMPSDVTGTEVIQENLETGGPAVQISARPAVCQHDPGRRDQSHAPQDPGRHARSDAGAAGQSAGGQVHRLPDPFFVLATQNPLEQEGTYPLPEAQLDRFLLYIKVDYPSGAEEWEIARRVTTGQMGKIRPIMSGDDIIEIAEARHPRAGERPGAGLCLGPGAGLAAGYARSRRFRQSLGELGRRPPRRADVGHLPPRPGPFCYGRYHATVGDVQAIAKPALRHRIASNYAAQAGERRQRTADRDAHGSGPRRPQIRKTSRVAAQGRGSGSVREKDLHALPTPCSRTLPLTPIRPTPDMSKGVLSRYLDPEVLSRMADRHISRAGWWWAIWPGRTSRRCPDSPSNLPAIANTCPGDDPKHIDWRVYFTRDKYFIKQYEMETNFVCHLVLDVSASMRYGEEREQKLLYAAQMATTLGLLDHPSERQSVAGHVRRSAPRLHPPQQFARPDRADDRASRRIRPPSKKPAWPSA